MPSASLERFDIRAKAETAALVLGILVTIGAAYHTGNTGNWMPLMATSVVVGLLVVLTMDV